MKEEVPKSLKQFFFGKLNIMLFRCCGGAFLKYFIKILEGTLKKKLLQ
jgi:hypothetical protein